MHIFDQDIDITAQNPSFFNAVVSDNWSVNGIPDGGYLMAIITNAMMQCSEHKSTPILTANYISRSRPGEAVIEVEPIKQSRQFNRLGGKLCQGGEEKVRMFGTFATDTDKDACLTERYEKSPPLISSRAECIRIPEIPNYTIFHNMDIRLDPTCAGWIKGEMSKKSEIKGWIKFKNTRPVDIYSIALMADSFPPAILASQGMVAWVPTLEFTVNIRNIPETHWLKCVFRTRFVSCGLIEEDGEIWDEAGNIIALSRQVAQFRQKTP